MAAADDQREQRFSFDEGLFGLHEHSVDVAFEVIDADERSDSVPMARALANVMPTSRAPARPGPSVTAIAARSAYVHAGPLHGGANYGHDVAQVLARGELRHNAAVAGVDHLRGDDIREHIASAVADDWPPLVSSQELSMPRMRPVSCHHTRSDLNG